MEMEAAGVERTQNTVINNFQINNPVFVIQQFDRPVLAGATAARPACWTVFALAVAGLLSFLQLKFQGNQHSPFDTYPKTTFAALTSFLLYCFSHTVKLMHSSSVLFGPLFLLSVSSLLFPDSLKPVLIAASLAFSMSRLASDPAIRPFWVWLVGTISGCVGAERSRARNRGRENVSRNGRVMLPV